MNRTIRAASAALLLLAAAANAATLKPAGWLRVEGDSTLHKWTSTTTAVELELVLADEKADPVLAIGESKVKSATLTVPVATLLSGEKGLDKNMRKAMNAEKHPAVVYKIASYQLVKGEDGRRFAKAAGELTINGQTRPAELSLELRAAGEELSVSGAYGLKMSEFGIPPPKLMMGAIKVRDDVVVRFDLTLKTTHKEN